MYEAFELDANAKVDFVWDDAVKAALEEQIQERLELTGRCTVTHLQVDKKDAAGQEIPQHLLIVRHGGPLSSVAEYQEADGSRQERYYRPLNEATLLFSPDEGVIEVFSASPSNPANTASKPPSKPSRRPSPSSPRPTTSPPWPGAPANACSNGSTGARSPCAPGKRSRKRSTHEKGASRPLVYASITPDHASSVPCALTVTKPDASFVV